MLVDGFQGEDLELAGNSSLPLSTPGDAWLVVSGSMALFATSFSSADGLASRRYLFTISAGDMGFGIDGRSREILGVSLQDTHLVRIAIDDLLHRASRNDEQIAHWLIGWTQKLSTALQGTGTVTFPDAQQLETLPYGLNALHLDFLRKLDALEESETQQRSMRLRDREDHFQSATDDVLAELAAVTNPELRTQAPEAGPPLLAAVAAIADASGMTVVPPTATDGSLGTEQALRAIADSSHFRTRRVMLADAWWKRDCGPILVLERESGRPLAALPQRDHYVLADARNGRQAKVDARVAAGLQPFAYTVYRPFAGNVLRPSQMLAFSLRGRHRDLAVLMLAAIGGSLLAMFTPVATAALIDSAIPDADRSLLFQMGLGLLAAALGKALFDLVQVFATTRVATISNATAQAAVWDRLLKLRPSFLRQFSTGDLTSRAMAVSSIFRRMNATSLRAILGGVASLLNLALMFYYSVPLAWLGLAAGVVIVAATHLSGAAMLRRLGPLQALEGDIFGLTVQLINGISKLRISGTERFAFAYWGKAYARQQKLSFSVQRLQDSVGAVNQLIPTMAMALIFSIAGRSLLATNSSQVAALSTGSFLAFSAAFGTFISALTFLSNTLVEVVGDVNRWRRSQPILSAEPELDPAKSYPGSLQGRISLARVTFRYHGSFGPLTLEDISLHAEPGEFVAIVGPSGSGKSTIFRLLLGFERPTSGTVYYDGQDLNGLDVLAVRRQLGVVLQNSTLLSGSIFENIAAGAYVTLDEAWEAARQAGIAEDIDVLPMGMHTFISEGASNISVGQRQRLLIARALVLKPRVLLFDEATSALDNRAQAIVSKSLDALQVTRIVIAHRLSTIRNADRIYVLENGRVAENGSFAEVAGRNGVFARMMSRQML